METPISVTVENMHSPDNDMKLLVATGQTVIDVKHYISTQAAHLTLDEQCLLHEGRLLQDHEAINDLLDGQAVVSDSYLILFYCS
jgi:hypothetical protein